MLAALVFPEWFPDPQRRRSREAAAADLGEASRNETPAAAKAEAAEEEAAPAAVAEAEELPPYGDRSLPQEESLRGRVTNEKGEPVADAIVVAFFREWRSYPYRMVTAGRVRTEADGFFVIGPLERQYYSVLAVKKDVGVGFVTGQMPGAWVDIVLAAGARVEGTVTVRESGEPVAGARVILKDWTFFQEAATDAEGHYVLAPLPASSNTWSGQEVIVVADGFERAERTNLLLANDRTYRVDFALTPGTALTGKVVDAQTLNPIAGATVGEGWETYHRSTVTKEDGTFALEHTDTSPNLTFVVRAEGYLPQQRQSDGTGRIDFELDASLALSGTVKDYQDRPVAGARVYLHRIQFAPGFTPVQNNQQQTYTTSDEAGRFTFADVLPGQVAVIGFHRDHAPGEKEPVEIPVGGPVPSDVVVTLKPGLTVEGVVRDQQDNPLPAIQVQLQRSGWGQIPGYKYAHNYRWQENPLFYSDEKGEFVLKGAMAGKHWLTAWDPTLGWAGTMIEGAEGQRITGVVISFAGAAITGVFRTADGDPVPGAWIYARGPKNTAQMTSRWTQTDSLGRFKLGGLKEGSYDLNGSSPLGVPEPKQDVPAGTTDVELVLKATQVLTGEVTSVRTGRALERFFVQIQAHQEPGARRSRTYRQGTNWSGWIRSPDGYFERPVMPSTYDVTVKAPGHAPQVVREVVVEELVPPQKLFVTLDAGGGIQGTLTDSEGKPVTNQWLNARVYRAPGEAMEQADWMLGGNDQTDSRGRYFIEGLAPGTYLVEVNLGQRGAVTAQIAVTGTEMVTRNLQLLPTGTVTLKVVDEDGNPVQGVMFYFRDQNGMFIGWAQPTNAQGATTSQPTRMGPVNVQVYDPKQLYKADNFDLQVLSGKNITVDVAVKKVKKDE